MKVGFGEMFSGLNKIRQKRNNIADSVDLATAKDTNRI